MLLLLVSSNIISTDPHPHPKSIPCPLLEAFKFSSLMYITARSFALSTRTARGGKNSEWVNGTDGNNLTLFALHTCATILSLSTSRNGVNLHQLTIQCLRKHAAPTVCGKVKTTKIQKFRAGSLLATLISKQGGGVNYHPIYEQN